jgi:phage terminase large subunit-like protein
MEQEDGLELSPEQYRFLNSDRRFRGFFGGLGTGKTTVAILAALGACEEASRGMLIEPSFPAVEDILIPEIEDYAEKVFGIKNFKRSPPPKLELGNGSEILFRSAEAGPEKLRGPNLGFFGIDEAAYVNEEVWDVMLGRLRRPPEKAWVTTTPKNFNWVYEVFVENHNDTKYWVNADTRNAPWLSGEYIQSLENKYSAEMQRRELGGEFVALGGDVFRSSDIQRSDVPKALDQVAIGLDPAGGGADETGIVCVGRLGESFYVLGDRSGDLRPNTWARRVVDMKEEYSADFVVVEKNYGGDMVTSTLSGIGSLPIREETAMENKRQRADPVVARYEQGRVYHTRTFDELEKQMLTWDPDSSKSPDRIDALVYAMKGVMDTAPQVESEILFV